MVEQELDLQGLLVEVGRGKGPGAVLERRPGDGDCIDRI